MTRLPPTAWCITIVAVSLAAASSACSGSDAANSNATAATTTSTIVSTPETDGRLTIGVMLPPAATLLRDPLSFATESAIGRINDAGGVFGRPVRLIEVDEGDTSATGSEAVQKLLAQRIDAIVGPASSTAALGTLEDIVSSGIVACSPTASGLALDDFPDSGLFFRTIPSDSMQAEAMSEVAEQTGVQSVAIVHVDDAYGRPFAGAVVDALSLIRIDVATTVAFTSGDLDLADEVDELLASKARVVIVLADNGDTTQFLEAIGKAGPTDLTKVIVNDALRSGESSQRIGALPSSLRESILGVAPQAEADDQTSPFDPPGPFAANAFDCVTLIALAASQAGTDTGSGIAAELASVSSGGSACATYRECADDIADGLLIDYNGPSGITEIGANGDPTRARFDMFSFDVDGTDMFGSTLLIDV